MSAPRVRLVQLPVGALDALLRGDLEAAGALAGVDLPPFFLDEGWLWRIRSEQVRRDPGAADWVVRAVVTGDDVVVGHAGFHGPPDEHGDVEVGYTVVPEHRGRGWAKAALAELLARADREPDVRRVVATIAPDNAASLAVVAAFGFVHVGEQMDSVDGRELVYVRSADGSPGSISERLSEVGLGQDYDSMVLGRTTDAWLAAGIELRARVARLLDGVTGDVEVIGSSAVLGLLAKPIIDLAVGLDPGQPLTETASRLEADGWIYRGDAGADGGHVFVLEARPRHRVAHLHVVTRQGEAWRTYLRFRDLLRRSPEARRRYEAVKAELAGREPVDRREYTLGKTAVVASLLEDVS